MCSIGWKRVLSLVIGVLDMLAVGSLYSYNIYAPNLQMTFNFTQGEIDTIPSFGHLGFCVGVPAGVLHYKCGSMWMSVIGFIISTTGYLLIWSAFLSKFAYHYKAWLMSFYYFIAGHGLVYLYMEALITNMKNIPRRHRGTIVGFLDAVFGASGGFFILIYKLGFANSFWTPQHDAEDDKHLVSFVLFLAASCGFAGITSVIGLREYKSPRHSPPTAHPQLPSMPDVREYTASAYEYPRTDSLSTIADENEPGGGGGELEEDEDDLIPIVGTRPRLRFLIDTTRRQRRATGGSVSTAVRPRLTTPDSEEGGDDGRRSTADACGLDLLKSLRFHCLVWPFILTGGVCFVVMTNIEYVLESLHLDEYILTCILALSISNGLSRVICGIVSDRFVDRIPRENILLFALIPLLVTSGFVVAFAEDVFVIVLWSVTLGTAYGALWCFVPTIMSESYGMRYFGVNWGCTLFASAVFAFGMQRLFAVLYDLYVPSGGSPFCQGVQCFRNSSIGFVTLVVISIALIGFLCRSSNDHRRNEGTVVVNTSS